jgi:hypothetical protein
VLGLERYCSIASCSNKFDTLSLLAADSNSRQCRITCTYTYVLTAIYCVVQARTNAIADVALLLHAFIKSMKIAICLRQVVDEPAYVEE